MLRTATAAAVVASAAAHQAARSAGRSPGAAARAIGTSASRQKKVKGKSGRSSSRNVHTNG
jgi:hypothetical protein